jgi:uncharacterized protein (TIGR02466 family)
MIRTLFPTDIYLETLRTRDSKPFIRSLIQEAHLFQASDPEGLRWSRKNYPAGYTSYSSITNLPFRSSSFERLKKWIDGHVTKYAQHLELDLDGGCLEMTTCWLNIMSKHSHHAFHIHPLSTISGTFYLQVPKGAGSFKIEDPRLGFFMGSPPRKANAGERNRRFIDVSPAPGTLLLFESWIKHEVTSNLSEQERISVSFNYDWIRS